MCETEINRKTKTKQKGRGGSGNECGIGTFSSTHIVLERQAEVPAGI